MTSTVQRIRRTLVLVAANDSETAIGGDVGPEGLDEIERVAVEFGLTVTRAGSVYAIRRRADRGAQ